MSDAAPDPRRLEVSFPGGSRVEARYRGQTVVTDQPVKSGGSGTAASPFDLFLASIATCAGFYALEFCRRRDIETEGLALSLETVRDPDRKLVAQLVLHLTLPPGFPEKYRRALARSVDQCAVKRHLLDPPEIVLELDSATVSD